MKRGILLAVLLGFATIGIAIAASEDEEAGLKHPEARQWTWEGWTGTFDRTQLQRGYQVYKEVCAACHSMHLVSFRNLSQPGGPEFTDAQMKAIAASYKVPTKDEKGEDAERAATPADRFPSPFPNEAAARAANNDALPPDLSVIMKARHDGANYVYALLTGYTDPPANVTVATGLNYNPYFLAGKGKIAMPAPLTSDGQVTYADGNPPATKAQMAEDVVAFLMWAAEPTLEERKTLGVMAMIFLTVLAVLLYFAYKRLWRDVDH
jgi:ubiquinol-cytochrome c reductase cytochrome c1 subunit